jgi:hypothetical protein
LFLIYNVDVERTVTIKKPIEYDEEEEEKGFYDNFSETQHKSKKNKLNSIKLDTLHGRYLYGFKLVYGDRIILLTRNTIDPRRKPKFYTGYLRITDLRNYDKPDEYIKIIYNKGRDVNVVKTKKSSDGAFLLFERPYLISYACSSDAAINLSQTIL